MNEHYHSDTNGTEKEVANERSDHVSQQAPVVQSLVSANPVLKFNTIF